MPPLAAIKRVPRDVLLELLGAAYEASEFDWVNTVDDRTLLCLVCKEWNDTIQSSAQFWRSVPINGMTSSSFIERQLGRSRQLDLNIFIHLTVFTLDRKLDLPSNCSLKGPVHIVRNLLPLLLPQIHRVATIFVECLNQTEWMHAISVFRESDAPRLRSLSVSHYSATGPNVVLPAFVTTPPLSSLSISTSGVWMDMATYRELKTLRLTGGTRSFAWSTFISMVRAASTLRCLQLVNVSWCELDKFTHVDMDTVLELHVTHRHWFDARPLDHIHFPNLRILRLSGAVKFHDAILIFSDFLPHLHRLELAFAECNQTSLNKLIVAAANLFELHILPPCTAAWKCIVQSALEGTLQIPHLRSITVHGSVTEDQALSVLGCAGSGCVLHEVTDQVTSRGARWVIGGKGLVKENERVCNMDTASEGTWKTQMYASSRKMWKESSDYAHFPHYL